MKPILKENMSAKLITVSETDSLTEAYSVMLKNNIRHLPALNTQDEVVGIISERDLQRAMISEVSGSGLFLREKCTFNPDHEVRDYMSWPITTATIEDNLKVVVDKMFQNKISACLILDQKQVVGIVTTDDMLGILSRLLHEKPDSALKLTIENLLANPSIGTVAQLISDAGL